MKDFNYYAPTEVVFGEQSEEQVAALVKKYGGTKVLVHYGGKRLIKASPWQSVRGDVLLSLQEFYTPPVILRPYREMQPDRAL